MKPLNRKERRIAFMKFMGVFLLAIAIVISSAFVAGVKIPPSAYSKQGQICEEQETLMRYIDTLKMHVEVLKNMDKQLSEKTTEFEKGEIMKDIQGEEIKLTNLLGEIKNLKTDLPEKDAVYQIGDAYLLLRTISKKTPPADRGAGSGKEDCESWKERLRDANDRIAQLKTIAKDASEDLSRLKVRVLNFNRAETKKAIENISEQLDKTNSVQKVPVY